ncbi:SAM-dependent methyltransferase [Arcobacter sp. YIC-464]|uniref:SAM-dependent methyltransferase n=1 Tax=Arcobacter sp. YIC-464 TaxID=3376631 RepID=UPI003C1AAFD8
MIRFNDYFNDWLYGNDGYYSNYKEIGKEGDFFTSVSTSCFFGGSIAKKLIDSIEKNVVPKNTTLLEIGAHHGYLLADIIQFIYTLKPELLDSLNFAIVERFENLQIQQKNYIEESFGDKINLKHYNDISEVKLDNAFIVANEIFDAFACDLVYTNKDGVLQNAYVNEHKIEFKDCEDTKLIEHCKKYSIEKGEVCLDYEEFVKILCNNINSFEFVTFDYGDRYPRNDFSARVYKKHNVYPIFDEEIDLKKLFKKSDITYDVHFNYLKELFEEQNVKSAKFSTQLKSLVDFGILDLLEILKINVDENTYLRETQKVKMLLEPTGMGDRFKTLNIIK